MSIFIKDLIRNKMSQLSPKEILTYSRKYGFSITDNQATTISNYIKNHDTDPFSEEDRTAMLQDLAKMTDWNTAEKAQRLFHEIVESYNLKSLFYN